MHQVAIQAHVVLLMFEVRATGEVERTCEGDSEKVGGESEGKQRRRRGQKRKNR